MKGKISVLSAVLFTLLMAIPASAATQDLSKTYESMGAAVILLVVVTVVAVLISAYLTVTLVKASKSRKGNGRVRSSFYYLLIGAYAVALIALIGTVFCGMRYNQVCEALQSPPVDQTGTAQTQPSDEATDPSNESTAPTETQPVETTLPTEPEPTLNVVMADDSNPKNWNVKWDIIVNESITDSYDRGEEIFFGNPAKTPYSTLPGIITFRGDNYRTGAAYGLAEITDQTFTQVWERQISSISKPSGSGAWTGAGWTGQPLIVQWDAETRQIMNLYPEKKAKDGLVEVIYATLDGNIYFYDLEDGTYTRDPMRLGMAFKGSGALDPRGYPIMYVGSGDKTKEGKVPRMYIINLIDCTVMFERGNSEPFTKRSWIAFDSSPLVDVNTDTLIWPGETGLLYTFKLNTEYDKKAGTLTVAPEAPVMNRYTTNTGNTIGFESSSIIVENYIYIADNGGMLFCVDLNTMELKWSQFVYDDTNATPCFEWGEDGNGYIYTASSMEFNEGTVYICKINASTGEFVWKKTYEDVYFDESVSGGVLSSPVLGKPGTELQDVVIYSVSRTPGYSNGVLVALSKETGDIVWEKSLNNYAWSSPVAVYNEDGTAHVVICDSAGRIQMLNGKTGETVATINVGSNVEASPAVFNDMLVVGTRGQKVVGIRLG